MPYEQIGPSGRIEHTAVPITTDRSTTMQDQNTDPFKTNGSSPPLWRAYYDDFDPTLDAALYERLQRWERRSARPRVVLPSDQFVYVRGEVAVASREHRSPKPEDVSEWVAEAVLSADGKVRVIVRSLSGRIIPAAKLSPETGKALRSFVAFVHGLVRAGRIQRVEADQ